MQQVNATPKITHMRHTVRLTIGRMRRFFRYHRLHIHKWTCNRITIPGSRTILAKVMRALSCQKIADNTFWSHFPELDAVLSLSRRPNWTGHPVAMSQHLKQNRHRSCSFLAAIDKNKSHSAVQSFWIMGTVNDSHYVLFYGLMSKKTRKLCSETTTVLRLPAPLNLSRSG